MFFGKLFFSSGIKTLAQISKSYTLLIIYQIRHQTSFQQPELNPFKLIKSNINTNCVWSLDLEFPLSSAVQPIYIINNVSFTISQKKTTWLWDLSLIHPRTSTFDQAFYEFSWKKSNPKGHWSSHKITFMLKINDIF